MSDIQLKLKDNGQGAFLIEGGNVRLAEMEVAVNNGNLTVYHTEVAEELKGKGVASKLLATMVAYARENKLKVIPLCPYVLAQFKRRPDQYADIWNKTWLQSQ
jgi:predicted GNAT family acetyltransferase